MVPILFSCLTPHLPRCITNEIDFLSYLLAVRADGRARSAEAHPHHTVFVKVYAAALRMYACLCGDGERL